MTPEGKIKAHLVRRVKELGGEVRYVQWVGRKDAPDIVVMLPRARWLAIGGRFVACSTIWVEVKSPEAIKTFPANAHERAQDREHKCMREMGQVVVVVGTEEQVKELLQ